jgi:hypothetical protein
MTAINKSARYTRTAGEDITYVNPLRILKDSQNFVNAVTSLRVGKLELYNKALSIAEFERLVAYREKLLSEV